MNEELIDALGEAMKRREKARAAMDRWEQQFNDANEDIRELSARIMDQTASDPEAPTYAEEPQEWTSTIEPTYEPTIYTPEQV